jgi:hypothetical protein
MIPAFEQVAGCEPALDASEAVITLYRQFLAHLRRYALAEVERVEGRTMEYTEILLHGRIECMAPAKNEWQNIRRYMYWRGEPLFCFSVPRFTIGREGVRIRYAIGMD